MVPIYYFLLLISSIYSYVLLDPNITLLNNPMWTSFRNTMVQFGYYQRPGSTAVYVLLILALFFIHLKIIKNWKGISLRRIAIVTSVILVFSYPFLSHDIFNYIFDARILTHYHQNPYLHRATDFPQDPSLRFMHWVHRTYPYGPSFLVITLIPSFLGLGKFLPTFLLFKFMFICFYLFLVRSFGSMKKEWGIYIATHPLVLMEGIVNTHNDLIALSLAGMGIWYLFKQKNVQARLFFLVSGGIKFVTLPLVLLQKEQNSALTRVVYGVTFLTLVYMSFMMEVQPWYFLTLLIFVPYFYPVMRSLWIFFLGLLISYSPYILMGTWADHRSVGLKHAIITLFAIINSVVLLVNNKKLRFRSSL